jgi:hypothetical protein
MLVFLGGYVFRVNLVHFRVHCVFRFHIFFRAHFTYRPLIVFRVLFVRRAYCVDVKDLRGHIFRVRGMHKYNA